MKSVYSDQAGPEIPRLALRPREAALALGMSEKTLWSITQPRGSLPAVKIGSRVAYFPHQIRQWADRELARQEAKAKPKAEAEATAEAKAALPPPGYVPCNESFPWLENLKP